MLQKHFLEYFSRHEYPTLAPNDEFARNFILDFKAGEDYTHETFALFVAEFMRETFGTYGMKKVYLCHVPAYKVDTDSKRWCAFFLELSSHYGIKNIYAFTIPSEGNNTGQPSHVRRADGYDDGERADFFITNPEQEVAGRDFVIIDDIYTTGKSVQKVADYLTEHGGNVIGCVTLAKTHTK